MSNFQIGLVVLGGLVLLGLRVHSAWSARVNTPKQAQETAPAVTAQNEPVFEETSFGSLELHVHPLRRLHIDPLIDAVAPINLDPLAAEVTGEAALAALPSTRRVGTKPFSIEGFNSDLQEWEAPVAGAHYSVFQAGVQLANRTGALNDIEYSEFVVKAQAFADAVGATPEFPEMRHEVARARELDNFASAHDAQLGLNLRAKHASWSPGYVHQMASQQGFVPGLDSGTLAFRFSDPGAHAHI